MQPLLAIQEVAQRPEAGIVVAQACFYIGIVALLGVAVAAFVFEQVPLRVVRAVPVAWATTAVGAIAIGEMRRRALAVGLGDFLETPLGLAALWRGIGLLVAHEGMMIGLLARGKARRFGLLSVGLGAAIAAVAHASSSHASAGGWSWMKIAEQSVHIIAVGAWIGGLAALLLGIRGSGVDKGRAMRRFSAIAGVALFVVAGTGFLRAYQEVGTPSALVSTGYGRLVILKTQLLLALAIAGTINRYRHVTSEDARGLRRAGAAELGIAVVAFAMTGILSGTVPAREAHASSAPIKVVRSESSLQGDTVVTTIAFSDRASLQVYCDPDRAGLSECHLTFFDASGGEEPIQQLTLTARKDGRTAPVDVRRFTPGHFVAGMTLTAGDWRLEGTVRRDGQEIRFGFARTIASR